MRLSEGTPPREIVRRPYGNTVGMHHHLGGRITATVRRDADEEPSQSEPWQTVLRRWFVGFLIATGMFWLLGAFFTTEVANFQWDPDVQDYVIHGTRWHGKEGHGSVHFDDDGILGVASPLRPWDEHVVIWGDSFVESLQVGDVDSVYSQLTAMARQRQATWRAVAVAQSGRNIVDHARLLGAYTSKIPNVKAHVVVVSAADVLCPIELMTADALKGADRRANAPVVLGLRPIIQEYRLHAFWMILSRYRDAASTLRFRPGPLPPPAPALDPVAAEQAVVRSDREAFWRHWATEFKKRSGAAQVVVVYHPQTPFLDHGTIVYDDPAEKIMADFAAVCRQEGIGFLSLTEAFCTFTRETGGSVHGFANSFPFRGHWNRDGHRLAAETICDYLCANK
jgi:hypothetical protein